MVNYIARVPCNINEKSHQLGLDILNLKILFTLMINMNFFSTLLKL